MSTQQNSHEDIRDAVRALCSEFPAEYFRKIDEARASLVVTVRPDGTPLSVTIVSDPGHGFGRAARMCALTRRFTSALDKTGQPIAGSTVPFGVRFTR